MLSRTALLSLIATAAFVSSAPSNAENDRIQKLVDSQQRLIQLSPKIAPSWMSHDKILDLKRKEKGFMDVTNTQGLSAQSTEGNLDKKTFPPNPTPPADLTQKTDVARINSKASTSLLISTLKKFTSFHNRFFMSVYGKNAAEWLFKKVQEVADENNKKGLKVSVTQFKHEWGQHSIIARIEGLNNNQETVIVGAHLDSINIEGTNEITARAPGADDDGSGTVSILEAFRLLLLDGYQPLRPVEFHWYSAEEVGLVGSQEVAKKYRETNRTVMGMMQLDMTGYPDPVPTIGIATDFVSPALTDLLRKVSNNYTSLKTKDFKCGYACSDHASWTKYGFPAARPAETPIRPLPSDVNSHSARDTLEVVNYDHMLVFSKLAVGWIVELSHK